MFAVEPIVVVVEVAREVELVWAAHYFQQRSQFR